MEMIWNAGGVVKGVMAVLVGLSVLCWAILLVKWVAFRSAHRQNRVFLNLFWNSKSLDEIYGKTEKMRSSPVAEVFRAGFRELQKLAGTERDPRQGAPIEVSNVNRAMSRTSQAQIYELEHLLNWLATTASAAPFVGLFGTVWGIMTSFQRIGASGSASLAVVAPGISEALIATAMGLAAAIPAAIFYNNFVQSVRRMSVDMEGFTQDFLNIVQRGVLGSPKK